jgi:hypothetical protein
MIRGRLVRTTAICMLGAVALSGCSDIPACAGEYSGRGDGEAITRSRIPRGGKRSRQEQQQHSAGPCEKGHAGQGLAPNGVVFLPCPARVWALLTNGAPNSALACRTVWPRSCLRAYCARQGFPWGMQTAYSADGRSSHKSLMMRHLQRIAKRSIGSVVCGTPI